MGKQNGGLLRNFLRRNTQVLAVCEVDTNRRENAARAVNKYYAGKAEKPAKQGARYTDFRELIAPRLPRRRELSVDSGQRRRELGRVPGVEEVGRAATDRER